jgi:glycosyltransferase involved in cell wall biosynthesis
MKNPPQPAAALVSVITPAWNAAETLRRAYDSLRAQECNWQHIIVNDGSSDDTEALIRELSANDSRIVYASRKNGGPGAALNTGLSLAAGDYVAFLDADDEYLPGHLSLRLNLLETTSTLDIVWGGVEVVCGPDDNGLVPDVEKGTGEIPISECVVQGTIFGRRRVFDTLRFSEDRSVWFQDYDLIRRAKQLFSVGRVEFPTYRYYRNSGGSLIDRIRPEWMQKTAPGSSHRNISISPQENN